MCEKLYTANDRWSENDVQGHVWYMRLCRLLLRATYECYLSLYNAYLYICTWTVVIFHKFKRRSWTLWFIIATLCIAKWWAVWMNSLCAFWENSFPQFQCGPKIPSRVLRLSFFDEQIVLIRSGNCIENRCPESYFQLTCTAIASFNTAMIIDFSLLPVLRS